MGHGWRDAVTSLWKKRSWGSCEIFYANPCIRDYVSHIAPLVNLSKKYIFMAMNIPSKLKLHLAMFGNAARTSHPISVQLVRTLKENVMALLCWWPKFLLCHATGKISRLSLLLATLTLGLEMLGSSTGSIVLGVWTTSNDNDVWTATTEASGFSFSFYKWQRQESTGRITLASGMQEDYSMAQLVQCQPNPPSTKGYTRLAEAIFTPDFHFSDASKSILIWTDFLKT